MAENKEVKQELEKISDVLAIAIGNGLLHVARDHITNRIVKEKELQNGIESFLVEIDCLTHELDKIDLKLGDLGATLPINDIKELLFAKKEVFKRYDELFSKLNQELQIDCIAHLISKIKEVVDSINKFENLRIADSIKDNFLILEVDVRDTYNHLLDLSSKNRSKIVNAANPEKNMRNYIDLAAIELDKEPVNKSKALSYIYKVYDELYDIFNYAPLQWRLKIRYGLDIWLYLVAFIAGIFFFYYFNANTHLNLLGISQLQIDAISSGIVGGIFRGIWFLMRNLNSLTYNRNHLNYYLSCPIAGGMMGLFVYLFALGGIILFSTISITNDDDTEQEPGTNNLLILALALLAGYKWEFVIEWINQNLGNLKSK